MTFAERILLPLLATAMVQVLYFLPRLPDRMATHFDATGAPNGWMSRGAFVAARLALLVLLGAVFVLLPRILHRIPASLVNVPHKGYWWAPERRLAATRRLHAAMGWLGSVCILLLIFTTHLILRANLDANPHLAAGTLWIALGVFAVFVVAWLIALQRSFRVPRQADPAPGGQGSSPRSGR